MVRFLKKFRYAAEGWIYAFRNEVSFRAQAAIGAAVITAGFWRNISAGEWLAILLALGLVLALELVNSALEKAMDVLHPSVHVRVQVVKDMMAGAVLIAALAALAVGAIVFFG